MDFSLRFMAADCTAAAAAVYFLVAVRGLVQTFLTFPIFYRHRRTKAQK